MQKRLSKTKEKRGDTTEGSVWQFFQTSLCEFVGFLFPGWGPPPCSQVSGDVHEGRMPGFAIIKKCKGTQSTSYFPRGFCFYIFDVKIVIWKYLFPPVLCFLSNSVPPRPNECYLVSCQPKHIPAKRLIMETNMWWESVFWRFVEISSR